MVRLTEPYAQAALSRAASLRLIDRSGDAEVARGGGQAAGGDDLGEH